MTIEERLASLEIQLRQAKSRNRWLMGAILLLTGALIIPTTIEMSALRARAQIAPAKEVRASKFILEDEKGTQRAVLAADKNGVALELVDEDDNVRAHLMVIKEGPVLNLRDRTGRPRLQLFASSDNSMAGISLYNDKGVSLAQLNLTRSGYPALTLFDNNAKPRIMLGVMPTGPIMTAYDQQGNMIWNAINK